MSKMTLALFFKERAELLRIASTYLLGINESGNQKGNLSYLAGTKKTVRFFNKVKKRERGRSDDNNARAFLLSNTAEERVELLWDRRGVDLISDALPFGR